ncbi:hypothetical protein FM21_00190 [Streptomyces mutabilis]|uniref:Uncharacterized protein n=1 Tax=Streptomyces mutabilis TaxID=67332 RepID=A0A086N0G7_9ACTN|nr:hypothetical protein FM21_00190 [Streptomyces mutabilis]
MTSATPDGPGTAPATGIDPGHAPTADRGVSRKTLLRAAVAPGAAVPLPATGSIALARDAARAVLDVDGDPGPGPTDPPTDPPGGTWAPGRSYAAGDRVTYGGAPTAVSRPTPRWRAGSRPSCPPCGAASPEAFLDALAELRYLT